MSARVWNLGYENRHIVGAVNVDITHRTRPDAVHDLDRRPWPFPGDHFDVVVAQDVIEHLHDVVKTMEEIHRVCRDYEQRWAWMLPAWFLSVEVRAVTT